VRRIQNLLRGGVYLARGTVKAVQVGHLFPEGSRRVPAPAPGGTTEAALNARRREIDRFMHSTHRLPLAGLDRELRLLHLTDAHVRSGGRWLDDLAGHLRSMTPDAVLLTGDMVTKHWTEEAARALLAALPEAPLGRFAVMGNWEHWAGADPVYWGRLLAEHDVRLLMNEAVDLGPIGLAGTDDLLAGPVSPEELAATVAALPAGKPAVVMSHSPAAFDQLAGPGVHLVLSGHAHGGQIRVPKAGSFFVPKGTGDYVAGWFQRGDSHLFVSRGIGWSLAPLRWRCPPEIAEIVLTPR